MANDKVALSQDEVDKLMGIKSDSSVPLQKVNKQYKLTPFLSEQQIQEINSVCKNVYKFFKFSLRKKIGEPKIRKLTIKSITEQNMDEFFDSLSDNDFIYEAKIGRTKAYIKLDSFLFTALAGLKIAPSQKINYFQSEVLKDFVAELFVEGFARQCEKKSKTSITSLLDKDRKSYKKGKTGLCITINWNENLHSFGIEKIFLTKEMIKSFRTVTFSQ
ncbi:hypothetical protein [uncultured Treponema sp.]|uniref:hypothetical protein n=1 Tax=uncultured Treponema sp. TaxID=162155 RepID=UPI0025FBAF98|nr:hypothetical protein [uncultured Treponema sp.]